MSMFFLKDGLWLYKDADHVEKKIIKLLHILC